MRKSWKRFSNISAQSSQSPRLAKMLFADAARFVRQVTKCEALCIVEHGILCMPENYEQLPTLAGSMNTLMLLHDLYT